jgi:hypothetical protein
MLATSMHAQPGVYAVLLGSGVSTASGIPTGWGIVRELVKRVAVQMDDGDNAAAAAAGPEEWWRAQFGTELGYSALLEALAPTGPTRQGLLAPFFEPSADEVEQGLKRPTPAHRAIAQLVKRGLIRVIITTNFDRLMEQALTDLGVQPQVISRPDAVAGMVPLSHASATVVKLHGDYLDVESLNTDQELAQYPDPWTTLLTRVLDEYGLIISGWSADWDTALVRSIETSVSRRYPLYWDARSSGGINAQRLLANRAGLILSATDADTLFQTLLEHTDSLDRLSEPPLTTALAVARLKRYLPDPLRRIDLHDLVFDRVEALRTVTDEIGSQLVPNGTEVEEAVDRMVAAATPLLTMLINGVFYDDDTHNDIWVQALQRLLSFRATPNGTFYPATAALQHLPAQLALFAMSAISVGSDRDALMLRLTREPTWRNPLQNNEPQAAAEALHVNAVLGHDTVNSFTRWGESGGRWIFPQSHLIRDLLTPLLAELVPLDTVSDLLDDTEYRIALAQWTTEGTRRYPNSGEYAGEWRWTPDNGPYAENRLRKALGRPVVLAAYNSRFGGEEVDAVLLALREQLQDFQRRW